MPVRPYLRVPSTALPRPHAHRLFRRPLAPELRADFRAPLCRHHDLRLQPFRPAWLDRLASGTDALLLRRKARAHLAILRRWLAEDGTGAASGIDTLLRRLWVARVVLLAGLHRPTATLCVSVVFPTSRMLTEAFCSVHRISALPRTMMISRSLFNRSIPGSLSAVYGKAHKTLPQVP